MLVSQRFTKLLKLQKPLSCLFAKKKKNDDDGQQQTVRQQRETVEIQQKYRGKSAALYDHYVKLRERPLLTLDNYQIAYTLVLQRMPIFMPYKEKHFQYLKTKYQYLKKTKKNIEIPKQLQIQRGDFLFNEYERVNPENILSHKNQISKTEIYQYAEKSRYWRYSDPTIQDPKSVQTYGADNIFFIVKDKAGEWKFPSRIFSEKDKHFQIFTLIGQELFGGANNPLLHFPIFKPFYIRRTQDDTLDRGVGTQQMFFSGITVSGIPKFPTQSYEDYAWVPKAHFSEYFSEEYFNQVTKLTVHNY